MKVKSIYIHYKACLLFRPYDITPYRGLIAAITMWCTLRIKNSELKMLKMM